VCNAFGNHIPYLDYLAAFNRTRIPVKWPNAAPNLEPRDDIWPTDHAPVIRHLEDGANQFSELRWGFPPGRAKGAPGPCQLNSVESTFLAPLSCEGTAR
jgi:putative SOS response-associated peptidase YedK